MLDFDKPVTRKLTTRSIFLLVLAFALSFAANKLGPAFTFLYLSLVTMIGYAILQRRHWWLCCVCSCVSGAIATILFHAATWLWFSAERMPTTSRYGFIASEQEVQFVDMFGAHAFSTGFLLGGTAFLLILCGSKTH